MYNPHTHIYIYTHDNISYITAFISTYTCSAIWNCSHVSLPGATLPNGIHQMAFRWIWLCENEAFQQVDSCLMPRGWAWLSMAGLGDHDCRYVSYPINCNQLSCYHHYIIIAKYGILPSLLFQKAHRFETLNTMYWMLTVPLPIIWMSDVTTSVLCKGP